MIKAALRTILEQEKTRVANIDTTNIDDDDDDDDGVLAIGYDPYDDFRTM